MNLLARLKNGKTIHFLSGLVFGLFQAIPMNAGMRKELLGLNQEMNEIECADYIQLQNAFKTHWDQLIWKMNHFWKTVHFFCFPKEQDSKKEIRSIESRGFYDVLITDVLSILYDTEWPVGEALVMTLSRWTFQTLDEEKKSIDSSLKATTVAWVGELYKKNFQLIKNVQEDSMFGHLQATCSKELRVSLNDAYKEIHFRAIDSFDDSQLHNRKVDKIVIGVDIF